MGGGKNIKKKKTKNISHFYGFCFIIIIFQFIKEL